jgi:hypothetical protein
LSRGGKRAHEGNSLSQYAVLLALVLIANCHNLRA